MQRTDGPGEVLTRLAEMLGRLFTQHAQLFRAEVDGELQQAKARAGLLASAFARGLPILIAGVVLVSASLAVALGVALEPWLGKASLPLALALVGLVEALLGGAFLVRSVKRASVVRDPARPGDAGPVGAPPRIAGARAPGATEPAPEPGKAGGNTYGAMGRA